MSTRTDQPVFSRRLREAREWAGLSQRNLGVAASTDPFVASMRANRYETGVHQPDLSTLPRLARVLDLLVACFYADDERLARLTRFHRASAKDRARIKGLLAPYWTVVAAQDES